jgi:hypothetical protein
MVADHQRRSPCMPPTTVVAQLSSLPLMGIKYYKFRVGMLAASMMGEVSLLERLDAPLLHKRLVFLHITRSSMTCT